MAEPSPLQEAVTVHAPWLVSLELLGLEAWQWIGLGVALLAAWVGGVVVAALVLRAVARLTARTSARWDDRLVAALRGPARLFLGVLAFSAIAEALALPEATAEVVEILVKAALAAVAGWLAVRCIALAGDAFEARLVEQAAQEGADLAGRARGARTQVRVLVAIGNVVVVVVTIALVLLQFEVVRNLGASLLASAGLAGIVVGLAAQKTIGGIVAGLQLSLTQPVRIGDVVIVEGEWGKIEEITLTYVVVRIWDERRLVVPIARFLEQPFQNWTRRSTELLGTVFFHADYRLPVERVREALDAIVEGHPKWDGRVKGVVVTDVTERTIQVRALVSARDSGELWDLRCDVRERLVEWLRELEGGRYLPRARFEGEGAVDPDALTEG